VSTKEKIKWQLSTQIELIEKYNPSLKIDTIKKKSVGYNDVLMVNDNLFFKFPIENGIINRYKREQYITNTIRKNITFKIPDIKIIEDGDKYFISYDGIVGIDYWGFKKLKYNFWDLKDTTSDKKVIPIIADDLTKGKKIAFNLIYDASLSVGSSDFIDKQNYLQGSNAIYRYLRHFNNDKIQIREYDILADYPQKQQNSFLSSESLKCTHIQRMEKLDILFHTDDGNNKINDIYQKLKFFFASNHNLQPQKILEIQGDWLSKNFSEEYAKKYTGSITESCEIFKLQDEISREGNGIIRLSPHEKKRIRTKQVWFFILS
jgi:hypothetical protein